MYGIISPSYLLGVAVSEAEVAEKVQQVVCSINVQLEVQSQPSLFAWRRGARTFVAAGCPETQAELREYDPLPWTAR